MWLKILSIIVFASPTLGQVNQDLADFRFQEDSSHTSISIQMKGRGMPAYRIDPGVEVISSTTIESVANAFVRKYAAILHLDTNSSWHQLEQREFIDHGNRMNNLVMIQCVSGFPVFRSYLHFTCRDNFVQEIRMYNPSRASCSLQPEIDLHAALKAIETAERLRFLSGDSARPVWSFGIISRVRFPDFYMIRDSAGQFVPFEGRFIGAQLVVFPLNRVSPTSRLGWLVAFSDGLSSQDFLIRQFIVDAADGSILWSMNNSGGCLVDTWRPLTQCGKGVVIDKSTFLNSR